MDLVQTHVCSMVSEIFLYEIEIINNNNSNNNNNNNNNRPNNNDNKI